MMKTKFLLLLTVLLCGATTTWALTPVGTDEWNDGTKTLTVKSNPGDDAYNGVTDIEHLVISEGVTSIGSMAFYDCSGIASISFPNSLTSIDNWAFCYCSGLTTITFGTGLTYIGRQAFSGCTGLTSVDIPASVTFIGEGVFDDCSKLSSITVASGNTSYKSVDDVLLTNDGTMLLAYPAGKTAASYTIPATVTTIGDNAFSYATSLTSVTIPEGVTSIGIYAFSGSGLTSAAIPASVEVMSEGAFSSCKSLASVTFAGTELTSIGNSVFYDCSKLTSISIPEGVTSIGDRAFAGSYKLNSAILPSTLTYIGQYAFSRCPNLTNIVLSADLESIEGDWLYNVASTGEAHVWFRNLPSSLSAKLWTGTIKQNITIHLPWSKEKEWREWVASGPSGHTFTFNNTTKTLPEKIDDVGTWKSSITQNVTWWKDSDSRLAITVR